MSFHSFIRKFREQLLGRWKRRTSRTSTGRKARHRRSVLPTIELLECRLTPDTNAWTGAGGGTFDWSNPNNWSLNRRPEDGDDLVFGPLAPSGARNTNNDMIGLALNSITFQSSGYTLSNQPITLGNIAGGNSVIVNGGVQNVDIHFDVTLGGAAGNRQFFVVGAGGEATLSGRLFGTTGVEMAKNDFGILTLTRDNTGFNGPITVVEGVLRINNPNALGDTSADTTVQQNAQLQLVNVVGTIPEQLLLNGGGITSTGGLLNVTGNTTWGGNIILDSDASLGAAAGSLNITGQISDSGAGHNLSKEGAGQIIFSHVGGNTYRGLTTINNGILTIRDPLALGPAAGTPEAGTLVNKS